MKYYIGSAICFCIVIAGIWLASWGNAGSTWQDHAIVATGIFIVFVAIPLGMWLGMKGTEQ